MAAPSYYDNSTNEILDGTVAQASDVENKCDDIAASMADVAADMDNTIRFTSVDFTDQTLSSNAATRAYKVVGFDASGNVALLVSGADVLEACETAQTAAELAETNAESARDAALSAQSTAETAVTSAQTAQGLAEDARDAAIAAQAAAELAAGTTSNALMATISSYVITGQAII